MGQAKNWSERRKKKTSGDWGWRGGGWGEGGGRRACETFFTDPLPPTFVIYLDNCISAVNMSICQFTEIVLLFLARVVRAIPVREQVMIIMSAKRVLPISMSTLQSAADFTRKTKIRHVSLFSVTKNKDLVAFTRV